MPKEGVWEHGGGYWGLHLMQFRVFNYNLLSRLVLLDHLTPTRLDIQLILQSTPSMSTLQHKVTETNIHTCSSEETE